MLTRLPGKHFSACSIFLVVPVGGCGDAIAPDIEQGIGQPDVHLLDRPEPLAFTVTIDDDERRRTVDDLFHFGELVDNVVTVDDIERERQFVELIVWRVKRQCVHVSKETVDLGNVASGTRTEGNVDLSAEVFAVEAGGGAEPGADGYYLSHGAERPVAVVCRCREAHNQVVVVEVVVVVGYLESIIDIVGRRLVVIRLEERNVVA